MTEYSNKRLLPNDLLESLDREIMFYRNRLYWLITYSVAGQIAVATGQQTIKLKYPLIGQTVYTAFFILIFVICWWFRGSLTQGIYYLRRERIRLVEESLSQNPYHLCGPDNNLGTSPSMIYVLTIGLLSGIGILVTWLSSA